MATKSLLAASAGALLFLGGIAGAGPAAAVADPPPAPAPPPPPRLMPPPAAIIPGTQVSPCVVRETANKCGGGAGEVKIPIVDPPVERPKCYTWPGQTTRECRTTPPPVEQPTTPPPNWTITLPETPRETNSGSGSARSTTSGSGASTSTGACWPMSVRPS